MVSKRISSLLLAALFLTGGFGSLRAEDWKTIDGKTYQDVQVLNTEPDAVTILHKDGGALVPLEMLPPDLQKRFNFDPEKAKAAADARMREEIADARALRAEREQAREMREAEAVAEDAAAVPEQVADGSSSAQAGAGGAHYSMDDLVGSMTSLRRDLSDPDYHTTANLAASVHSLGPDRSDPNHHSISEITSTGL